MTAEASTSPENRRSGADVGRRLHALFLEPGGPNRASVAEPRFLEQLNACSDQLRSMPEIERRIILDELTFSPDPYDIVLKNSFLFNETGDTFYLRQIVHPVFANAASLSLKFIHYIYWAIQRHIFLFPTQSAQLTAFVANDLFRLYKRLVEESRRRLPPALRLSTRPKGRPVERLVFIVNQFLGPQHQPSRDVFTYSVQARRRWTIDVSLVNADSMPLETAAAFYPPVLANRDRRFNGLQSVEIDDDAVTMATFDMQAFTEEKLAAQIDFIQKTDPDAVVAVGGSCVVADLLAGFRPTLCVPTTTGLTISLADIVFTFNSGKPESMASSVFPDRIALPFRRGFPLPKTWTALDRAAIAVPSEAPLFVVVGNRLDAEVSDAFLSLLETVLDRVPNGQVRFAGAVETLPSRLVDRRHAERLHCLGHVQDIRALYRITDAVLNPPRTGGGASVAYALAEGVPVVTLSRGDGASVAGSDFVVTDTDGFVTRCQRVVTDPILRADLSQRARDRFAAVGDTAGAVDRLVEVANSLAVGKDVPKAFYSQVEAECSQAST